MKPGSCRGRLSCPAREILTYAVSYSDESCCAVGGAAVYRIPRGWRLAKLTLKLTLTFPPFDVGAFPVSEAPIVPSVLQRRRRQKKTYQEPAQPRNQSYHSSTAVLQNKQREKRNADIILRCAPACSNPSMRDKIPRVPRASRRLYLRFGYTIHISTSNVSHPEDPLLSRPPRTALTAVESPKEVLYSSSWMMRFVPCSPGGGRLTAKNPGFLTEPVLVCFSPYP